MRVLYWTPRRKPESLEREAGLTFVPLDQLLAESDFVSLHPPLTPETRHQIGARELKLMKQTAFLINTARGPIIDEAALVRALRARRIAGAGLDVFEHEPKVDAALRKMPNVVLAPHLGSATVEVREEMANIVVDNILALLDGKTPPNCVNPEVLAGNVMWSWVVVARHVPGSSPAMTTELECRHAPPLDRRHRQPVSLARSGQGRARARRSGAAHGEEPVRRRHPGGRARRRRHPRHLRQAAGRAVAPAQALQGDRPLRPRRRQHRHQGGGGARHHRHLCAGLLHAGSVRPRDGAAAVAGAQGAALQQAGAVRPLGGAAGGADPSPDRTRARPGRLRQHSAHAGAEGEGVRAAGRHARSLRVAGGAGRGRRGRRRLRRCSRCRTSSRSMRR